MSLFDSAKSQLNSVANTIKTVANATINSTTITYGFIGVSTAIISYYTFFENDIEVPQVIEQPTSSVSSPLPTETASSVSSSIFGQQQQGGKRKKTRRNKKE
jgi:hypothetical protein